MKSVEEKNEQLRRFQFEHYTKVILPWLRDGGCHPEKLQRWLTAKGYDINYSFCEPFFMGIPDYNGAKSKKLVMVVGQETDAYGRIDFFDGDTLDMSTEREEEIKRRLKLSQEWAKKMTKLATGKSASEEYEDYNGKIKIINKKNHSFFKFLEKLSADLNRDICWNNLDKIHYLATSINNISGIAEVPKDNLYNKTVTLYGNDESALAQPMLNGKPLLLNEINAVEPYVIIFAIGNNYKRAMEEQLDCKISTDKILMQQNPIINITEDCHLNNSKVLWSYHPRYLNKLKIDIKSTFGKYFDQA